MTGKLPAKNDKNKDNERLKSNIPWVLKQTEKFEIKLKWILKKHPNEATAILDRLDSYVKALNGCNEPQQVVWLDTSRAVWC